MAKKSGFNLNPGADATLVAAATKAAMANVPKDLSGTFQAMSLSYDKAMSRIGASFGKLANTLGQAAGQLANDAIQFQRNVQYSEDISAPLLDKKIEPIVLEEDSAQGREYVTPDAKQSDPPGEINIPGAGDAFKAPETPVEETPTMTVADELRSIRKELFSLFLKNDKQSQARKRELRAKRDKRFALIKTMRDDDTFNNKLFSDGNVDEFATGTFNMALKLGQNAYRTQGGKITEGDFKGYEASLVRDENDNFHWILKDPNGQVVTGENSDGTLQVGGEKPYMVDVRDMGKMFTPKIDQKVVDDVNKIFDQQITFGSKKNTQYLPNQVVNKFRPLLENEQSRQQLASLSMGNDDKSLREHFNSRSEYSAEIFAGLNSATLTEMGVEDANNDGYIGDNPNTDEVETADFIGDDVATSNYDKVQSAIFNRRDDNYDNGSHLKAALKKHIENVGKISFDAGKMILTGGVTEEDKINIQKQNQKIALQNFQTNFPGGLIVDGEKFDEINTGSTVVNTPSEGKGKTVSNRVLSGMTLGLMRRADIPSNNPEGGEYKWNQQDNMYYYHRTGQTPQPIKDINTFYTNEFGSDYNAQNLMPFDQHIKDWSGDPNKTGELNPGSSPAGYAGYTVDNNKSVPNMLGGNYYKADKVRQYFKLAKAPYFRQFGDSQSYDDVKVVKQLNTGKIDGKNLSKYFTFEAVGGRNTIRATVKSEYKEFFGDELSKDFVMKGSGFIKPLSQWMSGKMKTYAENKIKAGDYKIKDDIVGQIYTKKVTEKMAKDFPALKNDIGKTITFEYLGTGQKGGMKLLKVQE